MIGDNQEARRAIMMRQHAAYQERSNQTMHLSGPRGNVLDLGALEQQYK